MPKKLVTTSPCGSVRLATENQGTIAVSLIDDDVVSVANNGLLIEATSTTFVGPNVLEPGQYWIVGRVTGHIQTNAITQITATILLDPSYANLQTSDVTCRGNNTNYTEGGFCLAFACLPTVTTPNQTLAVNVTSLPITTFRLSPDGIYITATRLT